MLLNEYEIEFMFRKIRNIRNLGNFYIRGPSHCYEQNRCAERPFYEESKVNKAVFAFKSINGETAPYLRETLKLNREQHCRNTRYAEVNFICPKYKRETEGGRTFSVTTIKLWNSLPLNLRRHLNVRIFKNKYVETLHAHQQSLSHF